MLKNLLYSVLFLLTTLSTHAQPNALRGKRLAVIGDSYVKNHREPISNTWHYLLAQKHGMVYLNYGRNGNCVSIDRTQWGEAMYKRYRNMADSLDYIIIIAGHNDASLLDSIGIATYKARANEFCQGLVERYPKARIFWFTCWNNANPNFLKVVDATKEVCGQWGIPVFDAARQSNIFALSDTFRDLYFQGGRRDSAHLNARGHHRFLPVAEHFILQYAGEE